MKVMLIKSLPKVSKSNENFNTRYSVGHMFNIRNNVALEGFEVKIHANIHNYRDYFPIYTNETHCFKEIP